MPPATATPNNGKMPAEMKIVSQNVRGAFKNTARLEDVIHGMGVRGIQIALFQDTQHRYRRHHQQGTNLCLRMHDEPGRYVQYYGETDPPPEIRRDMQQYWPFGAVWSTCDQTVEHTSGSAGTDIIRDDLELWDRVVRYGHFRTPGENETEEEKRTYRQNNFATRMPRQFILNRGGVAGVRKAIRKL